MGLLKPKKTDFRLFIFVSKSQNVKNSYLILKRVKNMEKSLWALKYQPLKRKNSKNLNYISKTISFSSALHRNDNYRYLLNLK